MMINNIQQQDAQRMMNQAHQLFMDNVHTNNMINTMHMMNMF
jgi:hypothetical protein